MAFEEVQRLYSAMVDSNMEQDNVALWKQERVSKMMVSVRQWHQQGTGVFASSSNRML